MTDQELAASEEYESLTTQEIYRKPRILIADKDIVFLDYVISNGKNMLCDFVPCRDISQALLEASRKEYDALILGVYSASENKALSFAEEIRSMPLNRNIPIAFVLAEGAKLKTDLTCTLTLEKPIGLEKLANTVSTLISESFEQFRALLISESPQCTARLAHVLEQANISSKFVLRPQRTLEFLYDFEPDVLLVDTELFAVSASDMCINLRNSSRWENMAIILFSSKGKACSQETVSMCMADDSVDLNRANADIGEKAKSAGKRARAATDAQGRDFLTGLSLRDRLYDKYIPQLQNPDKLTTSLTFAWLDINKLKSINEAFGHPTGDRVLVTLGSFLLQRLSETNSLVCRWGGDEIVIVSKGIQEEIETKISDAVLDFTLLKIPPLDKPVHVSAGIAHFPTDGKSVDELLDVANWRLHSAKRDDRTICNR